MPTMSGLRANGQRLNGELRKINTELPLEFHAETHRPSDSLQRRVDGPGLLYGDETPNSTDLWLGADRMERRHARHLGWDECSHLALVVSTHPCPEDARTRGSTKESGKATNDGSGVADCSPKLGWRRFAVTSASVSLAFGLPDDVGGISRGSAAGRYLNVNGACYLGTPVVNGSSTIRATLLRNGDTPRVHVGHRLATRLVGLPK
jgi:hypothetical protein